MAFRVYLTHTNVHKDGFFQVKGESEQLHVAVKNATTDYLTDGKHTVPGSIDALELATMLDRAWNMIAGRGARVPVATIVNQDKTLCVEIFR